MTATVAVPEFRTICQYVLVSRSKHSQLFLFCYRIISPGSPENTASIDNLFHLYYKQNSLDYLQLLFLLAVRRLYCSIEGLNGLTATVTVSAFGAYSTGG
jgi:hypothetical protein